MIASKPVALDAAPYLTDSLASSAERSAYSARSATEGQVQTRFRSP